jgi:hypothetical protein
MMSEKTLQEHMAACELTYQLMLDENRLLKTTGAAPGEDFLGQKRAALKQLEDSLAVVRTLRKPKGEWGAEERAAIQKTQQIVLKALLLDRENEQLMRKSVAGERPKAAQARPTLDQVQQLYRKHSGGG